jgi:curved DNA-binding protein CbpA
MTAAGRDHYRVLGVAREASREEIAQAWRSRARAEHPDSRAGEADDEAVGRFRTLADAWRVLADPVRRAAYDSALEREPPGPVAAASAVRVPVRYRRSPSPGDTADLLAPSVTAPLRAGPVRVEGLPPAPYDPGEREIRVTILAELTLRYLAGDRGWQW